MRDNAARLAVLEREVIDLKKLASKTSDRLGTIEMTDLVQSKDIADLKKTMYEADEKLDTVVTFITEARGAKKWVFGILAVITALTSIAAAYIKLK